MKAKQFLVLFAFVLLFSQVFQSCKVEEDPAPVDNHSTTAYQLSPPAYFSPLNIPADNELTEEGVLLGRHLYYDTLLSAGGPLRGKSCSSCHLQEHAFSDNNEGLSVLSHFNLAWNDKFLWDGKIEGTLEDIMHFEVASFFQTDVDVLRKEPRYPMLFKEAFGSEEITLEKSSKALAQFFRSLVSYQSEYDSVILAQGVDTYSDEEAEGYFIFFTEKGDCFHCHSEVMLTNNSFRNIGLDSVFGAGNRGRFEITGDPADLGKFKVPTLRNVAVSAPYMHDGRFKTLEEVVEHYNSGVKRTASLDPIMTKPGKELGLQLTEEEKASLVAFLKTLTDHKALSDPRHAKPF